LNREDAREKGYEFESRTRYYDEAIPLSPVDSLEEMHEGDEREEACEEDSSC